MNLFANKVADEIRESWQARLLLGSKDKIQRVALVAIAKEYPAALKTLLRAIGIQDINRPFLSSYATVTPSGRIICDMVDKDGSKRKVAVFRDQTEFVYELRKVADQLKLVDDDRVEMFRVLQKWITQDQRVNVHGEKLAS